jgi:hypothetical protein
LPLRKWFLAIYLIATSGKGISSVQLAKHIGVTQKTAWFMLHRIREAAKQDSKKLSGTVEADETYVGGNAKNMHAKRRRQVITGRGGLNKIPVFGLKTRAGKIRAEVIESASMQILHNRVAMCAKLAFLEPDFGKMFHTSLLITEIISEFSQCFEFEI